MGWNKLMRSHHHKWAAENIRCKLAMRAEGTGFDPEQTPLDYRVDIATICYFKNRPLDSDNINDKFYIDGLIGYYLHDDKPAHVRRTSTESRIDKDEPRVEIIITSVL